MQFFLWCFTLNIFKRVFYTIYQKYKKWINKLLCCSLHIYYYKNRWRQQEIISLKFSLSFRACDCLCMSWLAVISESSPPAAGRPRRRTALCREEGTESEQWAGSAGWTSAASPCAGCTGSATPPSSGTAGTDKTRRFSHWQQESISHGWVFPAPALTLGMRLSWLSLWRMCLRPNSTVLCTRCTLPRSSKHGRSGHGGNKRNRFPSRKVQRLQLQLQLCQSPAFLSIYWPYFFYHIIFLELQFHSLLFTEMFQELPHLCWSAPRRWRGPAGAQRASARTCHEQSQTRPRSNRHRLQEKETSDKLPVL